MHTNNNSPEPRKILSVPPVLKTGKVKSSSYINGVWYPKPGTQRMSKARFRLRAKVWRKTWFRWMKEHKFTWLMPLIFNILAALCILTFSIVGILLGILFAILAEIFLLIYLFKSMVFCFNNPFHEDTKMRMRDLGIPPGPYFFFAVVGGACIGLGTEFGHVIPWIGIILCIITLIVVPLLMYFKEGTTGINSYGPAPDDAPTEEELSNKDA